MDLLEYDTLLDRAAEAIENSYSPYSRFRVGACVLTASGNMYTGTNIENSSYSLTMCAERAAIFSAVSAGDVEIVAIAVYHDGAEIPYPCGACLQVMSEFNREMTVLVTNINKTEEYSLLELLPKAFSL